MTKTNLTAEYLREVLNYNPDTGVFTWKSKPRKGINIGDTAGSLHAEGYLVINFSFGCFRCHRLAWLYVHGVFPNCGLDHRNRDKSDNRIDNLREATDSENSQNRGISSKNASGYTGVSFHTKNRTWDAKITIKRKQVHIGCYATAELASEAYKQAKARLHTFNPTTVL